MPEFAAADVLNDLKQGKYSPVYFLQGEESYYIDLISDYIEKNAIEEAQKGFNQTIMYGKEHDVNTLVLNAKRFPMMSDRQVVIVKEAQEIKDLNKEKSAEILIEYIKNPLPSTILVIAHKNKLVDGRKAFGKAVKKEAVFVNSKKMYDNQIPIWITSYLKERGKTITPKGMQMMVESVGASLSKLSNELSKVLINLEGQDQVTEDHIQEYIGVSKDYNVFELQNALGKKDVLKANQIINHFEKNSKDNPLVLVVGQLYAYFSKLVLIHGSSDKNERTIAALLKVNPFFAKDYIQAYRNYTLVKLVKIIDAIDNADLQSKGVVGGASSEGQILRELIFKILH